MLAATIVTILGFYLHVSITEWLVLIFTFNMVLVAEMLNTSIESMVDLITKDYHVEAKRAKDVAAGMVLTSATFAVIVGAIIFLPKL